MATYSLAILGQRADAEPSIPQTLTLPDTSATLGGQAAAMQANTPLLCKRRDGSQGWFTLDAERSTPTNPVLKAVGP